MTQFTEMSRRDAYRFIFETAEKLNKILSAYDLERRIDRLAWRWNRANEEKDEIEVYPYAIDDFNEGFQCGIGINDEYIIFREYREEWDVYTGG